MKTETKSRNLFEGGKKTTSIAASGIAIILGIAVFILLAYKGLSPILASLVAAVIVGFTCDGGPFTAIFETFIGQAVVFMSNVLLLIVVGGLLAAVLEITGTTDSLAAGIIRLLGEKSIPIVVFVMTGLLCFLGVGSYQFIVAPLALGLLRKANLPRNIGLIAMMVGYNAVTYCLPGTSVTPNLMPAMILGTNIYAGGLLGIVAFILATALGLGYVYWMMRSYAKQGAGFEETSAVAGPPMNGEQSEKKVPPFWTAIVTIILLFGLCFLFSMVKSIGFDATQAVIMAQLLAALWAFVINFKYMNRATILKDLSRGTVSIIPLAVMLGFISGFGAVAQSTAAFQALLGGLLGMNISPYLLTFIGVAVLAGCMGNGTGALVMVLNALSPTLAAANANMGAVHRIATTTASTLDSLPHSTNVCVSIQVFGMTHKQSYKHVFVSTVLIPIIYAGVTTLLSMLIY